MWIHTVFDLLASISSALVSYIFYHWRLQGAARRLDQAGPMYAVALLAGAAIGGYGFGTLNLLLSGKHEVARSIVGALAGAIATIELFKAARGIRISTGLIFVPAFSTTVIVGRWGCYFAGLPDETHGIASSLPWAVDFGDGIYRHPVQIYESLAMLAFLLAATYLLALREPWFEKDGFYAMVFYYALQRFAWEFLKPYGEVAGPFNLFHLVCLGLMAYAIYMMGRRRERASP